MTAAVAWLDAMNWISEGCSPWVISGCLLRPGGGYSDKMWISRSNRVIKLWEKPCQTSATNMGSYPGNHHLD